MKTKNPIKVHVSGVGLAALCFLITTIMSQAQTLCVDTNDIKYLQPPNLTGFDVLNGGPWVLADDFICTNTGPIAGIHIWGSWLNDQHGMITNFWLGIYDDVPVNPNNPKSHPGNLLWSESFPIGQFAEAKVGPSQEQFLDPGPGAAIGTDTNVWYYCFFPTTPFTQTGSITAPITYWLSAYAQVSTIVGSGPLPQYGWKTTFMVTNDTSVHEPWPGSLPGTNNNWLPTIYNSPAGGQVPLDLAFRLTTPTNPPPPPVVCMETNGVKFLQPPFLEGGLDVWNSGPYMLADVFICTNSGPITDIHIWGSWLNDLVDSNSLTFSLAIYDNISPTNGSASYPGTNLLWQQTFAPGQYSESLYATGAETFLDPYFRSAKGNDSQAWYYCFYPTNPFVQTGSSAAPQTYWLAAYAQLPLGTTGYAYGWKTTLFFQNGTVFAPWPGFVPTNNPGWLYTAQSGSGPLFDLSFLLTTPTNPPPPPVLCVETNGVKYEQGPNLNGGYDVLDSTFTLADDFVCTNSGPITDIHLWGSFYNDLAFTNTINFWLGIFDDVPVGPGNTYSHPGTNLLWQQWFAPGQYAETFWGVGQEFFFDLNLMSTSPESNVWYYCFNPTNPFVQMGTAAASKTYWLAVFAEFGSEIGNNLNRFGWKTTTNYQNDISVHTGWAGYIPTNNPVWTQTLLPTGAPLDLAFMLTTPTNCSGPILITYYSTNTVVLTWPSGFLQSATNVIGPYADVPGATSPYTNSTVAPPYKFYRLRCY